MEQGTKAILGNMEHKKTIFDSRGTGKQAFLFQGNEETVIPIGGSHKRSNFQTIHQFVFSVHPSVNTSYLNCVSEALIAVNVKACNLIVLCILFKHTL